MSARAIPDAGRRYVHNIAPSVDREVNDFYPTPIEATKSLLQIEDIGPRVWEPACGDGAISRVLEESGRTVISSDLVDRGFGATPIDFLLEQQLLAPVIVTNPPFKLAEQFLHHALRLGAEKVVFMLRLAWLEGAGAIGSDDGRKRRVYDATPIARVHVSSRRLTMMRGGYLPVEGKKLGAGGMVAFAWYVWERGHVGDPTLRFFDWMDHAPECAPLKREVAETEYSTPLFD